ncbi:tRNA (adenosine(37)-N6)-threonylcarbamoyltransferase complex dimerization subunit type 1 TsaB [Borreliella garinii]|uniref:tRNA (adenosine(37)-N6)-threonylcarbamoyltransferase complex dimerization subunit type 1 TsaB n=1 Tax=Borreliella garinii TaxID=29519 RepID=UPI00018E2598|nr:tRNA (adenosine(37)-N6)-threonylcarbamoyltransferase complex dimerization subunit type 1 TsaB [Borreliella garinii]EED29673.1 glycoprotease family protein [Borreliella garinii Far04]WNZ66418.1 tRNA (adenosine(37)-N6)-threonylcarbamoyltransferase complex dimerization subunit type 1 TsaB [Borreliella garinii]WNZ67414.1 tRNA (adenosine(37)-N6)-threonylcarbamoyltransferase complex dimerization subunit type 1 TsaB [Borreliella garinii]WNZ68411.1 tRNA (adenosine(37)-N6)-threonylcarbamoyltransferas
MINALSFEYSYKALIVYCRINNKDFSLFELKSNFNFSIPKIFNDFIITNNIDLNQIKLIINSCGPGSFTGLRISLSFVKGLALGLSIPFVNISTLDVFANVVKNSSSVIVLTFTAGKYFLGHYKNCELIGKILCFSKEDLFEYLNQIDPNSVLIGNNLENISEKFNYKFEIIENLSSFGRILTELGIAKYLKNRKSDDILSGPLYIRQSDAEINFHS